MTDKDMPDEIFFAGMDSEGCSYWVSQRHDAFDIFDIKPQEVFVRKDIHLAVVAERDELRAVIAEMKGAITHALREHGGFTIKGDTERVCKQALAAAEKMGGE